MALDGTKGGITELNIDDLDGLVDVVITSPTSGQTLIYNAALNQWVNASAAGGGSGTVTSVSAGGGLNASTNPITGTGDIFIADTAVSAGSYTLASLTVNSKGQITAASNGAAGSGTVTSAAVSGNNGITVAGSPITTQGVIVLGLGDITPLTVSTSSATLTGKLTATTALFSGLVSADAGIKTTTVSAASIGVTGDINAAAGRVLASAATLTGKLTAATALFTGLVSADAGIKTTTLSAASIGLTGDINADRVIASAATFANRITAGTALFAGLVSADAGIKTTTVSAASMGLTGGLTATTGSFTGIVSANAGLRATTVSASGVIGGSNLSGTNTGDQTITLTGDVSGTGTGSFATVVTRIQGVQIKSGAPGDGDVLKYNSSASNWEAGAVAGTGTVTSVQVSGPAIINWSGGPITNSGTISGALANQNANTILAGPVSGAAAAPTFRAQINEDLPLQSQIAVVSVAYNGNTVVNAVSGSYFRGVAISAFTLSANNARDGQKIIWEIIQDGTGSRAITLGSKFVLGTDISAITLTTTASSRDFLGAFYNAATDRFYITAFVKGYA